RLPGLGCRTERQRGEVGLIRRTAVKTRMGATAIIKVEISADRVARLADGFVGSQIYLLVFDPAPQPFGAHIIPPRPFHEPPTPPGPFPLHADGDPLAGEQAGKS